MQEGKKEKGFSEILYQILVSEKKMQVKELAPKIGIREPTFYARLRGHGTFSPKEVKAILHELPDMRLINWFLSGTRFIPVDRIDANPQIEGTVESLRKTALLMLIEASEAANQIEVALADNRIDYKEAKLIRSDLETAERAIAALREHVRQVTN
ncbi:MAG: phage regulatory CII family protein [Ekhidna sp.]